MSVTLEKPLAEILLPPPQTSRGEDYKRVNGVYVHPELNPEDLKGYRLDPIVETVEGLGHVTLESVRRTGGGTGNQLERVHRIYGVVRDGFKHGLEITDPVRGKAKHGITSLEGLSEHIQGEIRQDLHARIAETHTAARVVSIETDGVGAIGDHYNADDKAEREKHSHLNMALSRLALVRALGGENPQVLMGTSQGCVIGHRMAKENTFGVPEDGRINLVGQIWVSPALVDPSRARQVMNNWFPLKFAGNVFAEWAFRSSLGERIHTARSLGAFVLAREDIGALQYQISQLRKGTPEPDIDDVLKVVPTLVIQGVEDAVAELDMWNRLQADPTNLLHLVRVQSRGHELAMKPHRLVGKLSKTPQYQQFFRETKAKSRIAA